SSAAQCGASIPQEGGDLKGVAVFGGDRSGKPGASLEAEGSQPCREEGLQQNTACAVVEASAGAQDVSEEQDHRAMVEESASLKQRADIIDEVEEALPRPPLNQSVDLDGADERTCSFYQETPSITMHSENLSYFEGTEIKMQPEVGDAQGARRGDKEEGEEVETGTPKGPGEGGNSAPVFRHPEVSRNSSVASRCSASLRPSASPPHVGWLFVRRWRAARRRRLPAKSPQKSHGTTTGDADQPLCASQHLDQSADGRGCADAEVGEKQCNLEKSMDLDDAKVLHELTGKLFYFFLCLYADAVNGRIEAK
uniref:Rho guanine nucleotide exchange factor 5 n=1 Tax=Mesocestoides corti TaxID=53468 RepID=A0A5K3EKX6_MESCO